MPSAPPRRAAASSPTTHTGAAFGLLATLVGCGEPPTTFVGAPSNPEVTTTAGSSSSTTSPAVDSGEVDTSTAGDDGRESSSGPDPGEDGSSGGEQPECDDDRDCGGDRHCDVDSGTCHACITDAHCEAGEVCRAGGCTPGCSATQPCPGALACCDDACVDLLGDTANCGGCAVACAPSHAQGLCDGGVCMIASCDDGYDDCNDAANDGCEIAGTCMCTPGQAYACYTGALATQGVGVCADGQQTCNAEGTALGPCVGQVLPALEVCGNAADDDCDGSVDEDPDLDGDGWTACGGDCCDEVGVGCFAPTLVNPGAFEFAGNAVDDDCDGVVDNALAACDGGLASDSASAGDFAKAIDLCRVTTLAPAEPTDRTWGLISAELLRADGSPNPAAASRAIRPGFGTAITPHAGSALAMLSTGHAADPSDVSPGYAAFEPGTAMGTSSGMPADWLAAHGNVAPNAPGCPGAFVDTAYNPTMLQLVVRAPTNASSFSVRFFFLSSEYPEYVCSMYNDTFVALVDSSSGANPSDGNIATYDDGTDVWPIGVNILDAADGLFTACSNDDASQCMPPGSTHYAGCESTAELAGTGFDTVLWGSSCAYGGQIGGGTGWLRMRGNVVPGELVTLRFAIWDTGDEILDSLVLLDDFEWSVDASPPGVVPG